MLEQLELLGSEAIEANRSLFLGTVLYLSKMSSGLQDNFRAPGLSFKFTRHPEGLSAIEEREQT